MAFLDYLVKKKRKFRPRFRKTRSSIFSKLNRLIFSKSKIDDDVLDELEEILISSDVGVETTVRIIEKIQENVKKKNIKALRS